MASTIGAIVSGITILLLIGAIIFFWVWGFNNIEQIRGSETARYVVTGILGAFILLCIISLVFSLMP